MKNRGTNLFLRINFKIIAIFALALSLSNCSSRKSAQVQEISIEDIENDLNSEQRLENIDKFVDPLFDDESVAQLDFEEDLSGTTESGRRFEEQSQIIEEENIQLEEEIAELVGDEEAEAEAEIANINEEQYIDPSEDEYPEYPEYPHLVTKTKNEKSDLDRPEILVEESTSPDTYSYVDLPSGEKDNSFEVAEVAGDQELLQEELKTPKADASDYYSYVDLPASAKNQDQAQYQESGEKIAKSNSYQEPQITEPPVTRPNDFETTAQGDQSKYYAYVDLPRPQNTGSSIRQSEPSNNNSASPLDESKIATPLPSQIEESDSKYYAYVDLPKQKKKKALSLIHI